jgi:hypothetical protein
VGLGEQAPLLQCPHGGAYRGRAGRQAEAPHQDVTAHGFESVNDVNIVAEMLGDRMGGDFAAFAKAAQHEDLLRFCNTGKIR